MDDNRKESVLFVQDISLLAPLLDFKFWPSRYKTNRTEFFPIRNFL